MGGVVRHDDTRDGEAFSGGGADEPHEVRGARSEELEMGREDATS
jgi:hypothetical protein